MQVWALSDTLLCSVENDLLFKLTLYNYTAYSLIAIWQHAANKHLASYTMRGSLMHNYGYKFTNTQLHIIALSYIIVRYLIIEEANTKTTKVIIMIKWFRSSKQKLMSLETSDTS